MVRLVVLAALLVGLGGCGHDRKVSRWNDEVLAIGRLQDDGQLDKAEARYQKLLEDAPDADARRYVLSQLARISEDRQDWAQAAARYERIYLKPIDDEPGAYALYQSGRIYAEHLGQPDRGAQMLHRTIERFPASVAAEFAVRELARRYRSASRYQALRRDFDRLSAKVDGTPIGDDLVFQVAEAMAHAGRLDDALAYYRRVYTDFADGGLADEALWESAKIYERRQQWTEAIAVLRKVADNVESSWFVGDYSSQWANDARFELGQIYLLFLDDYAQAIATFERYLDDFPTSVQADDAAWNIVEARRLMGFDADYVDSMRQFVDDYPQSRYVRLARQRLADREER